VGTETLNVSKRHEMTLAGVSYTMKRGEAVAKETGSHLDE
jgi:hypothetical protein